MSDSKGWIKLYRQILDCWIWFEDDCFSRGQAWIDLLLLSNHEDKKIMFDSNLLTIEKGQYLTSIRKLSERWNWSRKKTEKFLEILVLENMITKKSDNKKTLLTIVNYDKFQYTGATEEPQKSHRRATEEPQITHKQEDKELKNVKNNNKYIVGQIVDYLNEKSGKGYKATSQVTTRHISARLNEGFLLDDFKSVIDTKVSEWGKDEKMKQYIRPETLFGTKFESYLNQSGRKEINKNGSVGSNASGLERTAKEHGIEIKFEETDMPFM